MQNNKYYLLSFLWIFTNCQPDDTTPKLFEKLSSDKTHITFSNTLKQTKDFNAFKYRNFYNSGGVAIGDINNDELSDVYLSSNLDENKLYLNKGNFEFEDITTTAMVRRTKFWSTGVVMVDINNDGLLIYVCNAGNIEGDNRKNELFINNRDLTFTKSAADYHLDSDNISTHATFFDYDKDGDLDVYILNNSFIPVNSLSYSNKRERRAKDWKVASMLKGGGDQLLRNDNGKFVDVSEDANIYGSLIGFGLRVTIGDINDDTYPDIYISNDFYERDYLYINNVNQESFVYQNHSDQLSQNSYLKIKLKGKGSNTFAIGSVIKIYCGKQIIKHEVIPSRGFQSSVDYITTIGLGNKSIDSLQII